VLAGAVLGCSPGLATAAAAVLVPWTMLGSAAWLRTMITTRAQPGRAGAPPRREIPILTGEPLLLPGFAQHWAVASASGSWGQPAACSAGRSHTKKPRSQGKQAGPAAVGLVDGLHAHGLRSDLDQKTRYLARAAAGVCSCGRMVALLRSAGGWGNRLGAGCCNRLLAAG